MKIIADENITNVSQYFSPYGELTMLPGREIDQQIVKDADALLVRSITKVDKALLAGSSVRFVATATSGIDHIDTQFLQSNEIGFNYAPGCNAKSVVEYVFSALAYLSQVNSIEWRNYSFGIIGAGHIGGLLAQYLQKLSISYKIFDPGLNENNPHFLHLTSLEEVLKQNVISIHTPLTKAGPYPTYHLINKDIINNLQDGQILINAARGGVVDNTALLSRIQRLNNSKFHHANNLLVVLDAWENEPEIDLELLKLVDIGTPHIAGYSYDGKLNGTKAIHDGFLTFFQQTKIKNPSLLNQLKRTEVELSNSIDIMNNTILQAYNVGEDHKRMQALLGDKWPEGVAKNFDLLRKKYPRRNEFQHFCVDFSQEIFNKKNLRVLKCELEYLGFNCPSS